MLGTLGTSKLHGGYFGLAAVLTATFESPASATFFAGTMRS